MGGYPTMILALGAALQAWGGGVPAPPASSGFGRESGEAPAFEPDSGFATGGVSPARDALDKEIIRRIVRQHVDDVKNCYEPELEEEPDLFGRILVRFTIAASGRVIESVLEDSTMDNPRVESCTVQVVQGWEFPKLPRGARIVVPYPFVLTPSSFEIRSASKNVGAVEIRPLSPVTFVHQSTNLDGVSSNGLVAVTDRGLLLVDTAWTDAQTESILRWGETRFERPWIGAVLTHDHEDRAGGLWALERRHIPVSALDLTVAKLVRRGVRNVTVLFTARDGEIKDARGFEAFYPGPGHAVDNIVIHLSPEHFGSVLYGGCLIKAMEAKTLGFTGDADLAAWPAAVRRVRAKFSDQKIVPGHGAVDEAGAAYQHTLDLLTAANAPRGPRGAAPPPAR